MISVKGVNGTVSFDGSFITIDRKGAMARTTVGKGDKRIPIGSVTAVQWKPPGVTTRGYIQFTLGGGNEKRSQFGRATIDAAKDENSVLVAKSHKKEFEELRDAIEAAIAALHQTPAPPPPTPSVASPSRVEQLRELAELRDSGVLTEDEFAAEKARVLNQPE